MALGSPRGEWWVSYSYSLNIQKQSLESLGIPRNTIFATSWHSKGLRSISSTLSLRVEKRRPFCRWGTFLLGGSIVAIAPSGDIGYLRSFLGRCVVFYRTLKIGGWKMKCPLGRACSIPDSMSTCNFGYLKALKALDLEKLRTRSYENISQDDVATISMKIVDHQKTAKISKRYI